MSFLERAFGRAERDQEARKVGEDDAPADLTQSADHDDPVGRAGEDESADTGTTGAERRTGRDGGGTTHEGALRDE